MKTIIFVCHGNICRSVAAECIANKMIQEKGLKDIKVFSRATSLEEIGNDIYPPMKRELLRRNIPLKKHFAEIITQRDYDLADYVFYMDDSNKRMLDYLLKDTKRIIEPITMFNPSITYIEDPWYSDRYELVVDQLIACIEEILNNI